MSQGDILKEMVIECWLHLDVFPRDLQCSMRASKYLLLETFQIMKEYLSGLFMQIIGVALDLLDTQVFELFLIVLLVQLCLHFHAFKIVHSLPWLAGLSLIRSLSLIILEGEVCHWHDIEVI